MKLAQLKWIGLAMLAAGLSAGGVVAVGYAAVLHQEAPISSNPAVAGSSDDGQQKPQGSPPATTEERLKALEDKIDGLATRLAPPSTPLGLTGNVASNPPPREVPSDNRTTGPQPSRSGSEQAAATTPIGELDAQLRLAIDEQSQTDALARDNRISASERRRARGKVLIAAARIEELEAEMADELDRLRLEVRRKAALLEKARAEEDMASTLVARDRRLNQRKPGIVDVDTVTRTEAQLKAAVAETKVAELDVAEIELRIRQLERKRDRLKEVVKLARNAKGPEPLTAPTRPADK